MTFLLPAIGAAAGAIVGSFLATLCVRWPHGEQVMTGRSHCDNCRRPLRPLELVPIGSALVFGGRCRTCRQPFARLHLRMEMAAAGLAALALFLQPNAGGAALAVLWLLLLAPAVLDARHYWLPDGLTLLLGAAGLALGSLVSGEPLGSRLAGGAAGFLSLWLLALAYKRFRGLDGLGLGDAKLLGAIGLWTGWAALPLILVIASTAGIGVALAKRRSRLDRMPFGTMLALAAMVWTGWRAAGLPTL